MAAGAFDPLLWRDVAFDPDKAEFQGRARCVS